jgi:hypothetical protein
MTVRDLDQTAETDAKTATRETTVETAIMIDARDPEVLLEDKLVDRAAEIDSSKVSKYLPD